jgi:hypothetical protein
MTLENQSTNKVSDSENDTVPEGTQTETSTPEEEHSPNLEQSVEDEVTHDGEEDDITVTTRSFSPRELQAKRSVYWGSKRKFENIGNKITEMRKVIKNGKRTVVKKDRKTGVTTTLVRRLTFAQKSDLRAKLADMKLKKIKSLVNYKSAEYDYLQACKINTKAVKSRAKNYSERENEKKVNRIVNICTAVLNSGNNQNVMALKRIVNDNFLSDITKFKNALMRLVRIHNSYGKPISHISKTVAEKVFDELSAKINKKESKVRF